MTREELAKELARLDSGSRLGVAYNVFEILFPPGEPNASARQACRDYAAAQGCRVVNASQTRTVWFVKN
jgi:hypothetical protein